MIRGERFKILILLMLFICMSAFVSAQAPPADVQYYGYVLVDGVTPPAGTGVYVLDGNSTPIIVGNDTDGTTGAGVYSVGVHYNDPNQAGDQGVAAGEQIFFYVQGLFSHNQTVNTSGDIISLNLSVSDNVSPSAPSSLTALELSAGVINLSWTAATDNIGVQKYLVYRANATGLTTSTGTNIANTTNTFYNDTVAVDGSTYFYIVSAFDTANEGTASGEANVTVSDTVAPATPTGLTVVDVSSAEGSLFISWSANSESDFANYTLYFSSDDVSYVAETQTTDLNYTDNSLTDNSTYFYKLMAMDTSGNPSANTSVVNGTPTDSLAPTAVADLTVVDVTDAEDSVNISWTASTSADTAGYYLYRDDVFVINLTGINNVSYVDTAVTDGTQYSYDVSPYDEVPNFGTNATQTGTPVDELAPKAVSGVSTSAGNMTVNITWVNVTQNTDNAAITDLVGYLVYTNVSGTWNLSQNMSHGTLNYYRSTLTNLVTYQFKINAYDDAGNLGADTIVSATPSEMPTLSADPADSTEIESGVQVNISITSGQTLDTASYYVYNASSAHIENQTNISISAIGWNYSIDTTGWDEGSYKVVVTANDTNGQSNQQNFTYIVDDTSPSVTGPANSAEIVSNSTPLQLNISANDTNTLASVVVGNSSTVSMSLVSGKLYSVTTNASALGCPEGDCRLIFTATDAAGNALSYTINIVVDNVNPAIGSVSLSEHNVKSSDLLQANVTVSDANNLSTVTINNVSMNNITATTYNYTGNASVLGCSEGNCTLTFVATDTAGNTNTTTTTVIVDDTAPSINFVNITDNYVQNVTEVNVVVNVSDALTSVATVTAEGTSLVSQGNSIWNGTINLTTGNLVVDVVATDAVGNAATDNSTSFTIDDVAPVINSQYLTDDYVVNGTTVQLVMNISDDGLFGYSKTYYYTSSSGVGSGSPAVLSSSVFNTSLNLTDNVVNITIIVSDAASNSITLLLVRNTNFTVDDTAPSINSVSLSDDYLGLAQTVEVTVNVTDANTSSVTANTIALSLTSVDTWMGNVTMPNATGNLSVYAEDGAGNNATHTTTGFTVDSTAPTLIVNLPIASGIYSNADGNITFNFTVLDVNLTKVNVSIDNGSFLYGSAVNGTHTPSFSGLIAGSHTVVFTATDEASNNATTVSRTFQIIAMLNMSEVIDEWNNTLGDPLLSVNVSINNSEITSNESVDVNTSLVSIMFDFNATNLNVTARIPSFNGLNANWAENFTIEVNETSSKGVTIGNKAGITVQKLLLFEDISNFLANSDYGMAIITFETALLNRDVLYIDDDDGNTVYNMPVCSFTPSSIANAAAACYMNNTNNVTLYIPHFSGGALANDTDAPIVNITVPANASSVNNSIMVFTFEVYEANPNTDSFCNYTFQNGSTIVSADYDIDTGDFSQTGTKYVYNNTLTAVPNQNYTLNVTCIDASNLTTEVSYDVEVADTIAPTVSGISTSSTGTTIVTITLDVTTNEKANCRYATTNVAYGNMDDMDTTGNVLVHEHEIDYTSDSSGTYYVRCMDVTGNTMSSSSSVSYDADITSGDDSGSGGSGGGGSGSSVSVYTKTWSEIGEDAIKSASIEQNTYNNVFFTEFSFKALKALSGIEIQVRTLGGAPSSTGEIEFLAFKYIHLIENFDETDIADTKIEFRVLKTWLNSNGITKDNIALFRYDDGAWVEQPTTLDLEDTNNVYYVSETSGFSYFAIGQKEEIISDGPGPESCTDNLWNQDEEGVDCGGSCPACVYDDDTNTTANVTGTGDSDDDEEKKSSKMGVYKPIIILLIVVLIIVSLLYVLTRKKEQKLEEEVKEDEKKLEEKEDKDKKDDKKEVKDDKKGKKAAAVTKEVKAEEKKPTEEIDLSTESKEDARKRKKEEKAKRKAERKAEKEKRKADRLAEKEMKKKEKEKLKAEKIAAKKEAKKPKKEVTKPKEEKKPKEKKAKKVKEAPKEASVKEKPKKEQQTKLNEKVPEIQKLEHFVKVKLEKGNSPEDVKKELITIGWSKSIVEEVINKYK